MCIIYYDINAFFVLRASAYLVVQWTLILIRFVEVFVDFTFLTCCYIYIAGLMEVIIYSSPDDKKKNRGFCFLEYESHKAASLAKRRLGTGRIKVWGCDIIVDWADPQEEPDEQTMSKVKVLYVRNLTQEISEEKLKESFEQFGKVERVKKIKDYAFIHFEDRENAVKVSEEIICFIPLFYSQR